MVATLDSEPSFDTVVFVDYFDIIALVVVAAKHCGLMEAHDSVAVD